MISGSVQSSFRFPKSLRLLSRRDFQFHSYKRFQIGHFRFVYAPGGGRMGISLSKKAIRCAVGRNRVKRLLKEVFRHHSSHLEGYDLHVIGLNSLKGSWEKLDREELERDFSALLSRLNREPARVVS